MEELTSGIFCYLRVIFRTVGEEASRKSSITDIADGCWIKDSIYAPISTLKVESPQNLRACGDSGYRSLLTISLSDLIDPLWRPAKWSEAQILLAGAIDCIGKVKGRSYNNLSNLTSSLLLLLTPCATAFLSLTDHNRMSALNWRLW
jgi:hypothetical protein